MFGGVTGWDGLSNVFGRVLIFGVLGRNGFFALSYYPIYMHLAIYSDNYIC